MTLLYHAQPTYKQYEMFIYSRIAGDSVRRHHGDEWV